MVIVSFYITWADSNIFTLTKFSLIWEITSKIKKEEASEFIIIVWWVTQFGLPVMVVFLKTFQCYCHPTIWLCNSTGVLPIPQMNYLWFICQGNHQIHRTSNRHQLHYQRIVVTNNQITVQKTVMLFVIIGARRKQALFTLNVILL